MDENKDGAVLDAEENLTDAEQTVKTVASDEENAALSEPEANEAQERGILFDYSVKKKEYDEKRAKRQEKLQFVKYALCAASAGIIQFLTFTILQAVIPDNGQTMHFIVENMSVVTFSATTVALCLSILWNFTLNRKFTFKDAGNVPKAMVLAFIFYIPFYPFQTWYVHTIKELLGASINIDAAGIIAEGTVMIMNFILEFLWQKFVVFRKKKPTQTQEQAQ